METLWIHLSFLLHQNKMSFSAHVPHYVFCFCFFVLFLVLHIKDLAIKVFKSISNLR